MTGSWLRWVPWAWLLSLVVTAAICFVLGFSGIMKSLGPGSAVGICLIIGVVLGFEGMLLDVVRWGWL